MLFYLSLKKTDLENYSFLSLPNNVWRLIVFEYFIIEIRINTFYDIIFTHNTAMKKNKQLILYYKYHLPFVSYKTLSIQINCCVFLFPQEKENRMVVGRST
jgi:hypothetical protein